MYYFTFTKTDSWTPPYDTSTISFPILPVVLTNPLVPVLLLTITYVKRREDIGVLQVESSVIFWVVPSENVAVAVNCNVWPSIIVLKVPLSIAIDERVTGPTVSVVVDVLPDIVAVIVVVPWLFEVARPEELIVATAVLEEFHATVVETSFVPAVH